MQRLLFLACLFLLPLGVTASPIAGHWRFVPERSTDLSPWRTYDLTITVEGNQVTLVRELAAGRRTFADTTRLDTTLPVNVVPASYWPDNRHLGAYMGGDKTRRVRSEWIDGGRLLRLSTDVTLTTQQGDRAVNILSDYKVSANGAQLTLTELRSTRNRPVVYVFRRLTAEEMAKPQATGRSE
ncbi:MAG: hypothetical protein KF897_06735 [Opitutaceae bacterium]|nr:hypothetical protein [Opitutaceae bacterium]